MRKEMEDEESVRIAIMALGDMKNSRPPTHTHHQHQHQSSLQPHAQPHQLQQHHPHPHPHPLSHPQLPHHHHQQRQLPQDTPALSVSSSSPTSSSASLSLSPQSHASYGLRAEGDERMDGVQDANTDINTNTITNTRESGRAANGKEKTRDQPQLISKVARLPLVKGALSYYEKGKASSSVVKYGAEMMESSVISLHNKLPVNVNTLDKFACRQLDKFGRYGRSSSSSKPTENQDPRASSTTSLPQHPREDDDEDEDRGRERGRGRSWGKEDSEDRVPGWLESTESYRSPSTSTHTPRTPTTPTSASTSTSRSVSRDRSGGRSMSMERSRSRTRTRSRSGSRERARAREDRERSITPQPSSHHYLKSSSIPTSSHYTQYDTSSQPQHHHQPHASSPSSSQPQPQSQPQTQSHQIIPSPTPRPRWHNLLLEAGGLSAALSEESMRRLKYCLQWLQYATARIDAQILVLRDLAEGMTPTPGPGPVSASATGGHRAANGIGIDESSPTASKALNDSSTPNTNPSVSQAHIQTLTSIRRDLVRTIRQAVDVVSKYAGGALPEPARSRVRDVVLMLPGRWASAASAAAGAGTAIPPSVGAGAGQVGVGGEDVVLPGIDSLTLDAVSPPLTARTLLDSSSSTSTTGGREERDVVLAASGGAGGGRARRVRGAGVGGAGGVRSRGTSPAVSPLTSPRGGARVLGHSPHSSLSSHPANPSHPSTSSTPHPHHPTHVPVPTIPRDAAVLAATKILTLATESLGMMHSVTGVVKDSLDRADAWVGRLAVVGVGVGAGAGAGPGGGAGGGGSSGVSTGDSGANDAGAELPRVGRDMEDGEAGLGLGFGASRASSSTSLSSLGVGFGSPGGGGGGGGDEMDVDVDEDEDERGRGRDTGRG